MLPFMLGSVVVSLIYVLTKEDKTDGNGNGNIKKAIGLRSKTTTLSRPSRFFTKFLNRPRTTKTEITKF